jgi:hypothetical protein
LNFDASKAFWRLYFGWLCDKTATVFGALFHVPNGRTGQNAPQIGVDARRAIRCEHPLDSRV